MKIKEYEHAEYGHADWEKIFDLVAHESDPQMLSKYLDRLIHALKARNEQLAVAQDGEAVASQLPGIETQNNNEEENPNHKSKNEKKNMDHETESA